MSTAEPSGKRRVARISADIVWHNVQADLVLFHSTAETYHTLDSVASEVWRAIAEWGDLEVVTARLVDRFAADGATVANDVSEFVERASRLGLIVIDQSEGE